VKPDSGMFFSDERDLFNTKIKGGINFSTMINFSSRFPLFSPGANLAQNDNYKLHYVDGGYVENTGAGTMLEVLQSLKENSKYFKNDDIVPFVFVLRFGDDKGDDFQDVSVGNEMTEVVKAIYNTRVGRTTTAMAQLKRFTEKELEGRFINLCLSTSGSQVPLNWVLSSSSLDNLKKDIENKWKKKQENQLKDFFLLDSSGCVRTYGY
jgi:predicted transcriptional regulator